MPVPEGVALSSCWISMMRTVTRVTQPSIQKAPCRRARGPALGAPPSPAVLCHLLDHQKGFQRMLSPHRWTRREILGAYLRAAWMNPPCWPRRSLFQNCWRLSRILKNKDKITRAWTRLRSPLQPQAAPHEAAHAHRSQAAPSVNRWGLIQGQELLAFPRVCQVALCT